MRSQIKIVIGTIASAAVFLWIYETYMSTGWRNLESKPQSQDVAEKNKISTLEKYLANDKSCRRQGKISIMSDDIKSIWFAPYRKYPEMPGEGDQRGRGDYEYFYNIIKANCGKLRINYGAFKGSPADLVFSNAENIRDEFELAKGLGYSSFIIDAYKIWLTDEFEKTCSRINYCVELADGFYIVEINRVNQGDIKNLSKSLGKAKRFGYNKNMISLLKEMNKNPVMGNKQEWYDWEFREKEIWSWSKITTKQSKWHNFPLPQINGSLPSNLKSLIEINSKLRSLKLSFYCRDSRTQMITIRNKKEQVESLKEFLNSCQPKLVRVADYQKKGGKSSGENEKYYLSDRDSRISLFRIKYYL